MLNSLPKWSEVKEMYGESKVLGLETCQYYRESMDKNKWKLAVGGNFNSGTNFLYELLRKNCKAPSRPPAFLDKFIVSSRRAS